MLIRLERVLLFLVVLFLPTQLGLHFWPGFSFIYSLKIDYLSPTLYFWDLLVVGLLLVWILRKPKVNKVALNLFLFFLLTLGASLLGAANIGAGLVRLEQYMLAGFFGIFLASQDLKSLLGKIYLPLVLGIIGESLLAILQVIKGETLGLWILGERTFSLSTPGIAKFDFYGWQFLRPYGTFPHPNALAGFMLVAVILVSFWGAKRARMTLLITTVLAGLTIFLTVSRTAILAGFIIFVVLLKRKWLIFVTIITFILSPVLFTRFFSLLNFDNLTLLRREELVGTAWQIFLKHPVFGVGLNNFIPTVASDLTVGPSRFLQPVHNIFLLSLSETGLIGLIGLISLIGFPIFRFLKLHPIPYTLYPWLIIIFLGMFDHYFLTLPQGYRLLFLVWGLSFSPRLNRGSMIKYSRE
ncbi:O-antigen ligase family protein [Candidatus Daviesbacteria bacterium]|nr:O-antigen ligase family protein [Candidatus Daviesbacteria bacterium]